MISKEWKIPLGKPEIPDELVNAGYPPLLAAVLALDGKKTRQQADAMISGGESCFYDAMLILGMDRAAERVRQAIERHEYVAVYGDYDVDGITSTCLVTDYLRSRGLKCRPYIPDRIEEGYGLNNNALDKLAADGVSLVVTVDCGITAALEAAHAKELGMDMVITDHHECCEGKTPDAVAVIDCRQSGDTYPNKELAGVGMALKLVCAVDGDSAAMTAKYADLAAIGTIADVMKLTDENRSLVRLGLKKLAGSPRPGLRAMMAKANVDSGKMSSATIGFTLAPRLNAAGRLGKASTAAELIMCDDDRRAAELAEILHNLNLERKDIEEKIWDEANKKLCGENQDAPIVLSDEKWHQGVIGIVASRLAEQYSLPTIMICLDGDVGKGKGSCRSYGGFNLFDALTACSEHLQGFGGHALAAGLNIKKDKIEDFKAALREYYQKNRPEAVPKVICDIRITDPALLSEDNVRALDRLEPYGNGNPKPVMCLYGARLEEASQVGKDGLHLRMRVSINGESYNCIFFGHTAEELGLKTGERIDLAFNPQINEYHGFTSVQLIVSAARPHDSLPLCEKILGDKSGDVFVSEDLRPKYIDFKMIWKVWHRTGKDFTVGEDAKAVVGQCIDGMEPEKFCICLMALRDAGLLKSDDGRIFRAHRVEIEGKADLNGTQTLRTLGITVERGHSAHSE